MHRFAGSAGRWGNHYNMYIFPADGKEHQIREGKYFGEVRRVVPKEETTVHG